MNAPRDWTLLCLSCGAVVALSRLFSLYTVCRVPGYLVSGRLGTYLGKRDQVPGQTSDQRTVYDMLKHVM